MPDDDDGHFDPSKIKKRVDTKPKRALTPATRKAAKDEGRLPMVRKLRDRWKDSERSKKRAAEKAMRLVEAETNVEVAYDKANIRRNQSKAELTKSDREFIKEQVKTTARSADQEYEIDFLRERRRRKWENELDEVEMDGEAARRKHGRKTGPKRAKSAKEKRKERYRRKVDASFDIIGPETEAVVEIIEEEILQAGSWDDISTEMQERLLRAYEEAQRKDRGQDSD